MTDVPGDDPTIGERLDAKLAELRQAIVDTVGDVAEQVNQKLDDLQELIGQISGRVDNAQGQTPTE